MSKLPEILLTSLEGVKGFDKESFRQAHNTAPVTSVRFHPLKGTGLSIGYEVVPWCPAGRYLAERPVFTIDPLFHAGAYYVQEASSMFLDHMVRALYPDRQRLRVLDLCGAPGGKSTLLASLLEQDSLLITNEVIRSRASVLEENMTRWGYMNTWVTSNDPKDVGRLKGYFDIVVTDAPCSGSGMFRKDEKAIDEWSEANIALCSQRQQRILADIWPAIKEGGVLIYSTCSYSQEEDEDILDWMADHFAVESLAVDLPVDWNIVETDSERKAMKGYRFFPDRLKGEGFFIAAMRKISKEGSGKALRYKSLHDAGNYKQCAHLLDNRDWVCIKDKENYSAIYSHHEKDLQLLQQALYLRKTGVALGQPVKNEWLPAHDIALSIDMAQSLPKLELDREQALKFLKKEELEVKDLSKGWYVITYNGLGLGWIKALGNRLNNYLPKNQRIRMDITDTGWA